MDNKVIELRGPERIEDALTEKFGSGAQESIMQAVDEEFRGFPGKHAERSMADGRQRIARARDRGEELTRFASTLFPPCLRGKATVEEPFAVAIFKGPLDQ